MLPGRIRDVSPAKILAGRPRHNGPMPPLPRPSPRVVVGLAMVAAVLGRVPSLQWPLRPDEAGFLLVARAWHPEPDSMFGTYWVDRPPPIIALFKLSDWLGGPYFIRVVAALAAALFVLAAAGTARRLGEYVGARGADRIGAWVAVATAALTSHAAIDPVAAKGEILGLPVVMASCWFAINALMRRSAVARGRSRGAGRARRSGSSRTFSAGSSSAACCWSPRWPPRDWAVATSSGSRAQPSAAPCCPSLPPSRGAWSPACGSRPWPTSPSASGWTRTRCWPASRRARSTPGSTSCSSSRSCPAWQPWCLWFVLRLPRLLRRATVPTLAVTAMLVVDTAGVFLSGSYWRTYLLVPIAPDRPVPGPAPRRRAAA